MAGFDCAIKGYFVKEKKGLAGSVARESSMERGKKEPVQIVCPRCRHTEIIYLPQEQFPRCPDCDIPMIIAELLDEGKSY
jgi:hypothetical protein